jgi:prepilin-type N-terminal cleavage/methylation domain-containing protein/prepilin-type processing-associated H-X9-DG protein
VRKTKSKAFTLVELLVVIGIIALMIGILLPVLGSARRAAMNVKCLSNLRQCGQALLIYAHNNKGYCVPIRCGGSPPTANNTPGTNTGLAVPYELNGFIYGWVIDDALHSKSAAWWMNFLAKYLSSYRGGSGDVTAAKAALARNSPFWCPAWGGAIDPSGGGEWVHVTGYSMNYMVSLSPTHPTPWQAAATNTVPAGEWLNAQLRPGPSPIEPTGGTWYKLNQIRHPTQRCFLADAAGLFLEAWKWPAGGAPQNLSAPPPPQGAIPALSNQSMYTSGIDGQTTFDYYRHGVYPKKIDYAAPAGGPAFGSGGPCFDPRGGKVAYNILYFDGHAVSSVDRTEAYRAVRLRWPG